MNIRFAQFDDLEELTRLFDEYRQFYRKDSNVDAARKFLTDRMIAGESVIVVAQWGSQLKGFVQMYRSFSSASLGRVLIVNDLFVAPEARRKGIARSLLKFAAEYGKKIGAVRMDLSTEAANVSAQTLYLSQNWIKDETFVHFSLRP